MELSEEQLKCVNAALNSSSRIFAITGAAGTGKTTIIRHIFEMLNGDSNWSPAVVAPTGKAAKRIKEATGLPAVTIHKLLEYGRPGDRDVKTGEALDTTAPRRDRNNPLGFNVILVDEYSMVSHEVNRNLIDALPSRGRLIVFGDINQLPPVEKYAIVNANGSPFSEHLRRTDGSFTLTHVFRQAEESSVLRAASLIRKGIMPRSDKDFQIIFTDKPVDKLSDLVFEHLDNGIDFRSETNQILTPIKTRWIGTGPLNSMLQGELNPESMNKTELMRYTWDEKNRVIVGIGDKVVCTENTYDMRNYEDRFETWKTFNEPDISSFIPTPETKYMLNGETGIIKEIFPDGSLEIDFGDRTVEVPVSYTEYWAKKGTIIDTFPTRSIDLAYALTTHKAQGSEYDHVIYVINSSIFFMLSRENFYTAITRAKKTVTVITDQRGLSTAIRVSQKEIDKRKAASKEAKGKLTI